MFSKPYDCRRHPISRCSIGRVLCAGGLSLAGLLVALSAAGREPLPESIPLTLEIALAEALANNPSLNDLAARVAAAEEIPAQAGSLPDPRLNVNGLNLPVNTFNLDQEAMTQMQLGFSQTIPFPGKRRLRRAAAAHNAEAAAERLSEARLDLVREVRRTWWEAVYLARSLDIIERNLVLLAQFNEIAATKYQVGDGLQQDVLLAQLERTRLLQRRIELEGLIDAQWSKLMTLLAWPRDRRPRLPDNIERDLPEIPGIEVWARQARAERPVLAMLQSRIAAARANRELAEKSYYPDLTFSANYGLRQGNPMVVKRADFLSLMLNFEIPLFAGSKQDRLVAQKRAELTAEEQALLDAINRVDAEVETAWYEYQSNRRQSDLYDQGILPQARETVASMLAGYQVNKVDFLNLVQAEISLYNFEQQSWGAMTAAAKALADLETAAGREGAGQESNDAN